ncbi:MAG: hypothetical protein OXD29_04445 [Roseovarius sp.]|nr:hypothetical protein [Roseovarius sp.]
MRALNSGSGFARGPRACGLEWHGFPRRWWNDLVPPEREAVNPHVEKVVLRAA